MQIGIYDVELLIDGLSPFNTNGVSFVSLDIYEAIMNPVPNCILRMIIPLKWLENRTITDGTLLTIGIKAPKQNIDERYDFRLFNIEKLKNKHITFEEKINEMIDKIEKALGGAVTLRKPGQELCRDESCAQ